MSVTTGYACSACRTPVPDLDATSCANCAVDFSKVGPAPIGASALTPTAPATPAASAWRFPPEFDPSWSQRPWLQRHWRFVLFLAIIGMIVAVYAFLFLLVFQMAAVPTQRINSDLSEASGGEILSIFPEPAFLAGGRQQFILRLADNVTPAEATRLACTVVPGVLARDGYSGAGFELSGFGSNDLASSSTPCP